MNELALSLKEVSKSYGDFEAVRDLSFDVKRGSICGFLGPNGAGKTSSLRMILGISAPSTGTIEVLGTTGLKALSRIGFLPEERGLYRKMTAIDVIMFLAQLKGVKTSVARKRAIEMLSAQGLKDFIKTPIKSLSKGMSQKVQLISALVHEPELVILDEPFSGLDPVNQQGLEEMIRAVAARGGTVLFSTHVMQHAERLCEKVVLLAKGHKVFEGTIGEARARAPSQLVLEGMLDQAVLAALPGVASVKPMGQGMHGPIFQLQIASGHSLNDALKAAYLKGLDIARFEAKEPNLHEAFIVMTGGIEGLASASTHSASEGHHV